MCVVCVAGPGLGWWESWAWSWLWLLCATATCRRSISVSICTCVGKTKTAFLKSEQPYVSTQDWVEHSGAVLKGRWMTSASVLSFFVWSMQTWCNSEEVEPVELKPLNGEHHRFALINVQISGKQGTMTEWVPETWHTLRFTHWHSDHNTLSCMSWNLAH